MLLSLPNISVCSMEMEWLPLWCWDREESGANRAPLTIDKTDRKREEEKKEKKDSRKRTRGYVRGNKNAKGDWAERSKTQGASIKDRYIVPWRQGMLQSPAGIKDNVLKSFVHTNYRSLELIICTLVLLNLLPVINNSCPKITKLCLQITLLIPSN